MQAGQHREREPQEDPLHLLAPHLLQVLGRGPLRGRQEGHALHLHTRTSKA